jgi:hypothetical protein
VATVQAPASAVKAKKPSKWSASAYASMVMSESDRISGNEINSHGDRYVEVGRDIGKGQKVSIRPIWLENQTYDDRKTETTYFDTYLLYSYSKFYGATVRTNIPTGEWSRLVGRHELRFDTAADLLKSGKFTLTWAQTARRYWFTADSAGQRTWRWENDLIGAYAFNDKFTVFAAPKYEANWRADGNPIGTDLKRAVSKPGEDANPQNFDGGLSLEIGFDYTPVKNVTIEPSINHSRDIRSTEAVKLFSEKATSYELEATLSL